MSKFDDLQALGRMLDEGKIDRDEYDRLKADLMAEGESSAPADPMEKKPAGWYNDPSGKAQHQAYWDGEKWTGETRTQFQANVAESARQHPKPPDDRPFYRRGGFVVAAVIALAIAILAVTNQGDSGPPQIGDYIGEYGGERSVYSDILGSSNCSELQGMFDTAANNNDRETPGTRLFEVTLGYMTAADDRMEYVGCYD